MFVTPSTEVDAFPAAAAQQDVTDVDARSGNDNDVTTPYSDVTNNVNVQSSNKGAGGKKKKQVGKTCRLARQFGKRRR